MERKIKGTEKVKNYSSVCTMSFALQHHYEIIIATTLTKIINIQEKYWLTLLLIFSSSHNGKILVDRKVVQDLLRILLQ